MALFFGRRSVWWHATPAPGAERSLACQESVAFCLVACGWWVQVAASPCRFSVPPTPANHRREEPTPIPTTSTLVGVVILTPPQMVLWWRSRFAKPASRLLLFSPMRTHPRIQQPAVPATLSLIQSPTLQLARVLTPTPNSSLFYKLLATRSPRVPCRPLPIVVPLGL